MIKFKCNKLVRDKSLQRMGQSGIHATSHILSKENLLTAAQQKLIEESHEVAEATNRTEVISELVDVLDVIDLLKKIYNITEDELMVEKQTKFQERGAFEKGIFLEYIEMAEDNPRIAHFRSTPDKYPEEK